METNNIEQIKFNVLSQEQYEAAKQAHQLEETEFYLTPSSTNKEDLYYCTYGTTTTADITAAIDNGKMPVCIYQNRFYVLSNIGTGFTFSSTIANSTYSLVVVSVGGNTIWNASSYQFYIKPTTGIPATDLTTSLQSSIEDIELKQPKINTVFISIATSDWEDNMATKTVSGVHADETSQIIQIMPQLSSLDNFINSGIVAVGQASNSITFKCDTPPAANVNIYVAISEVI